ncbi:MAG: hypothetical protein PVF58_19365 [Candidatus Methanofastidiosia archaeon]|jgi:hypothetical protein
MYTTDNIIIEIKNDTKIISDGITEANSINLKLIEKTAIDINIETENIKKGGPTYDRSFVMVGISSSQ